MDSKPTETVISNEPERCPEAKHYEAYDWCELSDNICIRNTGNVDFDVACDYYNDFLREMHYEE